jgi:hypothetical protein
MMEAVITPETSLSFHQRAQRNIQENSRVVWYVVTDVELFPTFYETWRFITLFTVIRCLWHRDTPSPYLG